MINDTDVTQCFLSICWEIFINGLRANTDNISHLRQGKRRYRKGYGQKRGRIQDAVSIELRPTVVDERGRLGDWEADLVLGKQGTVAIVTLAERKSRIYLTKKVFSKDAVEVSNAIIHFIGHPALHGGNDVSR